MSTLVTDMRPTDGKHLGHPQIKKVGNRFYDLGTKNKSFLLVSQTLAKLGVKNCFFMLEIKDPSLAGIDPFDPNLDRATISRIVVECTKNMWYYLREVVRIPESGGDEQGVMFKANRGNIAQAYLLLHGIDSWLNLPRQQGKTVSVLCVQSWIYNFATTNSKLIFINKDGPNAKSNLAIIRSIIEHLPKYLRFESIMTEDGKIVKASKAATNMKHPINTNEIIIKPMANSYSKALSLARGLSAPVIHFDETEFTPYIFTIVANSYSTFDTASRKAKSNGAPYGRIFTSTPGDLDTQPGQDAARMLADTAKFTEAMYDMHYDRDDSKNELFQYVQTNSNNNIVYIEFSWQALGLTRKWFEKQKRGIGDPLTFKREILLQRLRGSSESPFAPEDIDYISNNIKPVIEEIFIKDHFRFDVYEKLSARVPYLVGIDCSSGKGNDNNAITIINPYTVKPVAEFSCSYIGETMFESVIIDLVRKYIPRAILIIERNNVGDSIIDHLLETEVAYNLYYDKNRDLMNTKLTELSTFESMLKKKSSEKQFYGVWTGTQSREDMFAILFRRMAEYKDDFITKNITNDIAKLIRTKTGKIEAGPGFHDDSIMSYLIALYVYYHGNNLQAFGFIKGSKDGEEYDKPPIMTIADLDPGVLPDEVVDSYKRQEEFRQENDYEAIYRAAIASAQKDTMRLVQTNMTKDDVIINTPRSIIEPPTMTYETDLDLFDELNDW